MIGKGRQTRGRGQATDFTALTDILRTASPKNLIQFVKSVQSVAPLLREIRLLDQVDRDGADLGFDPDDDSRPTISRFLV